MKTVPSQLAPQEDRGVIFAFVKGAEGTSYNRMVGNIEEVEGRLLPMVGQGVIKSVSIQTPAFGGRAGDQTGFVIMQLENWEDRDVSASDALDMVRKKLQGIPDVRVWPFMPGFRGGSSEPIQFVLNGADYNELFQWASKLKDIAEDNPMMEGADLDYAETTPELVVSVNRQRAAELGIPVNDIAETLEIMLGGRSETTFIDRGEEYDVYLRGDENSFNNASDLSQIYVRTRAGQLITLESLAEVEEVASAQRLSHNQKQKSITLKANLVPGYTLGQALDFLDEQALSMLPSDIVIDYAGESKDFRENQSSILMVFGLAYWLLPSSSGPVRKLINPMVVMLTVPMGYLVVWRA